MKPDSVDTEKADMFSLALCLLDAGLLNLEGDYLNGRMGVFDEGKLRDKLSEFGEIYSQSLAKILEEMLALEPKKRPDFSLLVKKLPGKPILRENGNNQAHKRRIFGETSTESPTVSE